ncbi:MAG: peptidoglycan DD-metalloendopeptidase family protein [Gammaproteobacteria bacterium]|nr:peptidoglycan DD-metalloendopeptidase family protein [Gammaproteobacteria bacterium]MDH5776815.1 peptidoglycan DD-metalloendopeptidase family protein [Gammaproteobacteria bacterium]
MDYNSFLTRDLKSLKDQRHARNKVRYSRLHVTLLATIIAVIVTMLVFLTHDAKAMRTPVLSPDTIKESAKSLASDIPAPSLLEAVEAETPLPDEIEQAEAVPSWEEVTVKSGDSLAAIFRKLDLNAHDLDQIIRLGEVTKALKYLKPGQKFKFLLDEENTLKKMVYQRTRRESLHIERDAEGFRAIPIELFLNKEVRFVAGTIQNSLFEAGTEAGLSDNLVMEMVGILGWDIDFASDIRKGDEFHLLYEEQFLDGEKISEGPIVAVEFINQNRSVQAIRYTDERGRSQYYTPDGLSMRKAFLRTPVDFRRISSRFGRRHHPILNRMKLHKGVDYSAPRGTPIKAAGDGRVVFRGRKGGYGRTVIIQHGGRYSTLYAHMSRYRRGIYTGKRVRQGQTIGYVGRSGRATGNHLHYEFRVHGRHRNPLTVRLPNAAPINKKYKEDFLYHSQKILAQLMTQKQIYVASLAETK